MRIIIKVNCILLGVMCVCIAMAYDSPSAEDAKLHMATAAQLDSLTGGQDDPPMKTKKRFNVVSNCADQRCYEAGGHDFRCMDGGTLWEFNDNFTHPTGFVIEDETDCNPLNRYVRLFPSSQPPTCAGAPTNIGDCDYDKNTKTDP